nr:MAG TPA: hypothetical protein [Caudoviricetes sp.]
MDRHGQIHLDILCITETCYFSIGLNTRKPDYK